MKIVMHARIRSFNKNFKRNSDVSTGVSWDS